MIQLAPPPPPSSLPQVGLADDDGLRRLRFRLWQWSITLLTVLVTTWCVTLGPAPAVLALMIAKHVLVAVYIMGMDVEALHRAEK